MLSPTEVVQLVVSLLTVLGAKHCNQILKASFDFSYHLSGFLYAGWQFGDVQCF